jgi:hypothetical protein
MAEPHVEHPMDDEEAQALRAEGLDPDDPAPRPLSMSGRANLGTQIFSISCQRTQLTGWVAREWNA